MKDVYDSTVSKGRPPMTETSLHTITTQKGKFVEPSSSRSMEKYTYDKQMNLSLATTITTEAKQLVCQPPEIELPGDIGLELAIPYYANVEWPKPKFNNLTINLGDNDGSIEDVKRLKSVEKTTKLFGAIIKSTVTSSRRGKETMRTLIDESDGEADLSLSRVWLRRWFYNVVRKPYEVVPSAAAVAMMEKALNGSRPCEREKKGAVTVWKT